MFSVFFGGSYLHTYHTRLWQFVSQICSRLVCFLLMHAMMWRLSLTPKVPSGITTYVGSWALISPHFCVTSFLHAQSKTAVAHHKCAILAVSVYMPPPPPIVRQSHQHPSPPSIVIAIIHRHCLSMSPIATSEAHCHHPSHRLPTSAAYVLIEFLTRHDRAVLFLWVAAIITNCGVGGDENNEDLHYSWRNTHRKMSYKHRQIMDQNTYYGNSWISLVQGMHMFHLVLLHLESYLH
jgi:hypothetical protein